MGLCTQGPFMTVVEFAIDVFFMVDICVNFRTGYIVQEDGEEPTIILDPKTIAKHYLLTVSQLRTDRPPPQLRCLTILSPPN